MPSKGEQTREKILEIAEGLILQKGFAGTSIDDILRETGITKGGFFYHFNGKNDLARHLLLRYLENDQRFFNALFERAQTLSEDPLQQMLIFLKLLAEEMANLPDTHPGCLVASFAYESQQVDATVRELNRRGLQSWRETFQTQLDLVAARYPARTEVSAVELADMLSAIIEGGIVLSKVYADQAILVQQLLHYRTYIRFLFDRV
ncbi:MAG TPA: TetR/AcrR family transcriptional regulator [Gammaproteobacteria bacterium]